MMRHKTMLALIMLLLLLVACGEQEETSSEQTIASPEVAESPEEPPASEADESGTTLYHIFVHERATGEQKRITEEPAPRYHPATKSV